MSNDPKKNLDKLTTILGFDPSKKGKLTQELLKDVQKEFLDKRTEEAKTRARTAITQAIQLQEQMRKSEKEFNQARDKFNKELEKAIKEIENSLDGSPDEKPAEDKPADGQADPPPVVENQ